MFVNKIGKHHLEYGENCQDYGKYEVITEEKYGKDYSRLVKTHKVVCDGCSEGKHSEVGVKLFVSKFNADTIGGMEIPLSQTIRFVCCKDYFKAVKGYPQINAVDLDDSMIKDYCCFTILSVKEVKGVVTNIESDLNFFMVEYCGDGYIITQDYEDNIEFIRLDDGEYPKYLAYNFIRDKSRMKQYQDGVNVIRKDFPMKNYKNVGVASDGIRFILEEEGELKDKFIQLLRENKEVKMKRFININQDIFKDDVTISF